MVQDHHHDPVKHWTRGMATTILIALYGTTPLGSWGGEGGTEAPAAPK